MKTLIPLFALLLLASCEEEVQMYDKLTAAERRAIEQASELKCQSANNAKYTTFKNEAAKIYDSSSFDRGDGFYYEYKEGNVVKQKADIRVWKRDGTANEVYFYITDTLIGASSYFVRVTQAVNEAMIDDLFADHCLSGTNKIFTSTIGSSSLSVKYEYTVPNSPNKDELIDSYTIPFAKPVFFANYQLNRTVTTKKLDGGAQVGNPVKYASTLTNKSYDFDGHDVATNSTYYTQKFCEIDFLSSGSPASHYRVEKYGSAIGYRLTNCTTTVPVGWDLTIP